MNYITMLMEIYHLI